MSVLTKANSVFNRASYALLAGFEDPVGTNRPLWRDYSRYQLLVNASVARINGVLGAAFRSGISWGYTDPFFYSNYTSFGEQGLYRTSYHVTYPDQPVVAQVDNWYRIHKEVDVIPRVIDLELQRGMPFQAIANHTWAISELVFSRDGKRPIIYSRKYLIDRWLAPFWSVQMMNEHFWWVAQYLYTRWIEHPGPPTLPNKVLRENVILHQTADKKPGFPGEQYGSASVDWDRWEIGNTAEMHAWIAENWGSPVPPLPPVYPWIGEVTAYALNVRDLPGVEGNILYQLRKGDRVEVWREEPNHWLLIDQNEHRYVNGTYIKRVS